MHEQSYLFSDVDHTIHDGNLMLMLVDELVSRGAMNPAVLDNERVRIARQKWNRREITYIDYVMTVFSELTALNAFHGLSRTAVMHIGKELVRNGPINIFLFTRLLIDVLKEHHYVLLAVSGSPTEIVEPFLRQIGFDAFDAERRQVIGDRYTPNQDQRYQPVNDKVKAILTLTEAYPGTLEDSIAIGDSISDLGMLTMASWGFAINPTSELLEAVKQAANITVVLEDRNLTRLFRPEKGTKRLYEVSLLDAMPPRLACDMIARSNGRIR